MRRYSVIFLLVITTFFVGIHAASADPLPPETPQLLNLGTISNHHTVTDQCLFVHYQVANAASFDFQYRGPDGNLYDATGSGNPMSGEVGVCPDSTWPSGFYYLHAIVVYANDPVNATYDAATYGRHSGLITYEPGDVVTTYDGFKHLTQDDFWLNS